MSAHSLTDTNGDRGMVKVMGMVLFSLFLLSLFLFSVARLLGTGDEEDSSDSLMRNALISRIEPIGQVRTSADDLPHGDGIEVASAGGGAERSGEELASGVCAGCHQAGTAGAPMLGDEEAWAERREQGLDYLVSSVIDGKGSMPARGGSDYSDEEIRRAVQHIALFEEEEAPAAEDEASGDAAVQSDAVDGESAADPVVAEETDGPSTQPSNDMASDTNPAGENDMVADDADAAEEGTVKELDPTDDSGDAASGTSSDGSGAAADTADGEAAATDTASGESVGLVAMIGSSEAPEGMADHVKGAVDGVCAGCHIAGAAGAPMLGDVDAWTPRAEMGLAALAESVTNGKGAMPARGGSQLTDEEIPVAIEYLISKQP